MFKTLTLAVNAITVQIFCPADPPFARKNLHQIIGVPVQLSQEFWYQTNSWYPHELQVHLEKKKKDKVYLSLNKMCYIWFNLHQDLNLHLFINFKQCWPFVSDLRNHWLLKSLLSYENVRCNLSLIIASLFFFLEVDPGLFRSGS